MAARLGMKAWGAIKAEYLAGAPARAIASRYGCSASRIYARSSAEKWRDDRTAPTQASIQQDAFANALNRLSAAVESLTRQGGAT